MDCRFFTTMEFGEWAFWTRDAEGEWRAGAVVDTWDGFWREFAQLNPANALAPGAQLGFFKAGRQPFVRGRPQGIDATAGRWVCHVNNVGGCGIVPRAVWESLVVRLAQRRWFNPRGVYPVKFLGKTREMDWPLIYSSQELNEMMVSDLEGIVLNRKLDGEYVLSVWNTSAALERALPPQAPKDALDKPFDYEITRYERPFNAKFDLYRLTGITYANYRRRIFGGAEGILSRVRMLLAQELPHFALWDEIDLVYKERYVFHKRMRRATRLVVEYAEEGLFVEEL